ncbi:MAG: alpha-amylase family glycosyl hydrolase [Alkaliphilus sp.]
MCLIAKRVVILFLLICVIIASVGCEKIEETTEQSSGFSRNDLIYFIMIDRFYDGDERNNENTNRDDLKGYHGGDIKGITKKLDYIKSLGATAIWITPVAENEPGGYHGYWISDFYEVEPRLGTIEDLKELVEEAHKRDIKILIDFVVNHTGYKSDWLTDEKYKHWFNPDIKITNWSDQEQVEKGRLAGLPDLNFDLPEVREYFTENALWWIEQTNIDGMRLDTVKHVPKSFWEEFSREIKEEYPDFFFLGEVWHDNHRYVAGYENIGLDSITNFPMYEGIRSAFVRFGKTGRLVRAIKNQSIFETPENHAIFIDNHDTTRFVSESFEYGEEYLKQALTFIMTYPALPVIYYGTEIGMEGENDPDNRRFMKWDKIENSHILEFYNKLVTFRENNFALINGDFELLDYDTYFLSYLREYETDSVVVVINVQNKAKSMTVNIPTQTKKYEDLLSGRVFEIKDGMLNVDMQEKEILILVSK